MNVAAVGAVPGKMETQRKKPLRTYSKKRLFSSANKSETQTSDKRRKMSPTIQKEPSPAAEQIPAPELPRLPAPPPSSRFEKGSILNYFKPCRSTSSADSDMLKKLASSSPPMSLDRNPPHRALRRLQLRPPAPLTTSFEDDDENDFSTLRQAMAKHRASLQSNALPSDDSTESTETNSSEGTPIFPRALLPQPGPTITHKKPTRTKSAPVQTTLNLSTKSTFEECKLCRIVYNPLHPPDVKFHAKQHKANLRNLSRA